MSTLIKTKYHERFEISTKRISVKPCHYTAHNFCWYSYTYEGLRFLLCVFQYDEAIDPALVGKWGGTWIVCSDDAFTLQMTKNIPMTVWYSGAAEEHKAIVFDNPQEAMNNYLSDLKMFEYGSVGKVYHLADNVQPVNIEVKPLKAALRSYLLHLGFNAMKQMVGF